MRYRRQRFLVVALGVLLALSYFFVPSLRPAPTPIAHATGNWTGGSAPGSGQAPWETLAGGVNVANGNLVVAGSGPSIPGVNSLDEVINPAYNSLSSTRATDMGNGWIMGTGRDVGLDLSVSGQVTFYDPTGHGYIFTVPSSCSFTPPAGVDAQLACSGSGYTLTFNASGLQYQFDSGGNLTALQNRQGNRIQFAYTTSGLLTQITNTEGQVTTVSYDASSRVSQITTPGSPALTWTYTYDASSNLTKITDAASHVVTYGYDASSRVTKITSAAGNVTNISYDGSGRVSQIVRVTNPTTQTGATWTFAYSSGSTQVTDPNNHTSTYVFDSSNRVTSVTDAENHTGQTSWTADNQVAQQIAPSGATTTYSYDGLNNLTQVTSPTGVTKTLAYGDPSHPYLPTSVTDEQGNTTTTQYNSQGLPASVTDAQNHTTTTAYNTNGTVASVTDANNHTTSYSYNALGLPSQVTPPSPLGIQTFSYDSYDRLSAQADGLGHSTGYSLDQVGNTLAESYADGSSVTHTYDGDSNLTNTTGELTDQGTASQQQVTNGGFESGASPWQVSPSTLLGWRVYDPLNAHSGSYYAQLQASLSYSQQLYQTVSVPSHYSKLTFSYWLSISTSKTNTCDAFTVQVRTTGGTPITTVSNPCPSGSLGLGKWGQESVDLTFALASYRGQQVQVFFQAQNPSTDQTAATYRIDDVALTAATDNTTYTYNALGQQTQQTIQNGGSIAMSYDGVGNMLTTADGTGTVTYTYGANNEVASAQDQWAVQTTYSYDQDGNQTQIAYRNGSQQFSYNSASQPTGMTVLNGSGATLASLSWNYTNPATNKQTDLAYSSTDISANVTTNTYDSLGQLTQATVKNSSGATIHTYSYTYDPVGNLLSKTEDGTTTSMTYNAADELIQAGSTSYTYNANGNRTGDSTGGKLSYNTAGQTTSITPAGGSALNMSYQGAAQRQRVAAGSNTYQYDATGLKSYFNAPKGTTAYIMDRPRGQWPVEYHYSGNTYYYVIDPTGGSVVAVYDPTGQVLQDTTTYTPTGEIVGGSHLDPANPIGWQLSDQGDGSGLDNGNGCYYDPTTGQQVSCGGDSSGGGEPSVGGDSSDGSDGLQPNLIAGEPAQGPQTFTFRIGHPAHTLLKIRVDFLGQGNITMSLAAFSLVRDQSIIHAFGWVSPGPIGGCGFDLWPKVPNSGIGVSVICNGHHVIHVGSGPSGAAFEFTATYGYLIMGQDLTSVSLFDVSDHLEDRILFTVD